ncbi:MAG TPA: ABC transporter permease [Candidatus Limnocylindrales bacterium]|jgi:peptide/nickel transport system permease protein|nr:ABC transporter permease [Candidatus Limnocylindrales bacterium]
MADPIHTVDPAAQAGMAYPTAPLANVEQAEAAVAAGARPEDYEVALKSLNQWQLAWRRYRRHRLALVGAVILAIMAFLAIFGPIIWPYDPLDLHRIPGPQGIAPNLTEPFGTDNGGRSVFKLVVNGARLSMLIGMGTMAIAVTFGVAVGAISGYFGGLLDNVLMRFVDIMLTIPFLFVILVAARFFGAGDPIILIIIFGVLSWPGLARLVRALFLSLREQEFVQAARAVGVGHLRIAFRHMLPNAIGPIVVSATLLVANAIILEAFVSFLNFGLKSQDISWGNALARSQATLVLGNWWWPFFPGMAIALTVIAINFMGDGLRDALDPRARE